jgi:WD40 repeat protein
MSRVLPVLALIVGAPSLRAADSVRLDLYGDALPNGALVRYGSARLRHPAEPSHLAFSRDGKWLVSVGGDPKSSAVVWDTTTGKARASLEGKGFAAAEFAPNGMVYLAAIEPTCVAWDPITGKSRALANLKVNDEARAGRAICVSPDGQTVGVGCDKGLIVWLDATSGKERGRFERRGQVDIQAMQYSANGSLVAVRAGPMDVFLVDALGFRITRSYQLVEDNYPSFSAVALNPLGNWLAVAASYNSGKNQVRLFETGSDELAQGFAPPAVSPVALHFSPDGGTLFGLLDDGKLFRWQSRDGKETLIADTSEAVKVARFQADGKLLAVANNMGFIRLVRTSDGKRLLPESPTSSYVSAFVGGNDGKLVVSRDVMGKLDIWDRVSGNIRRTITKLDSPSVSQDGIWMAAWKPDRTGFAVLDLNTGKEVWQSSAFEYGRELSFSPDSRLLASARTNPAAVDIWDVRSGHLRTTLQPTAKNVEYAEPFLSWSPDGHSLLAIDRERNSQGISCGFNSRQITISKEAGTASIWEVATGQLRWSRPISWLPDPSVATAWCPNGSRLVMIQNRILATYRVGNSVPLSEMLLPSEARSVSVSADCRWTAVGFKDGTIRVWASKGTEQRIGQGHTGAISSLAFIPDSTQLLSASVDGTALLWDVAAMTKYTEPIVASPRADLEKSWADLATAKGQVVLTLFEGFASQPKETVRFFKEHLKPAAAPNTERIAKLILELGAAKYEVREKAHRQLLALGEQAEPMLQNSVSKPNNAEAKRRIETLFKELASPPVEPDTIRQLRAVELLEQIGTSDARDLLKLLTEGDPAARFTKDAAAALKRLPRRPD